MDLINIDLLWMDKVNIDLYTRVIWVGYRTSLDELYRDIYLVTHPVTHTCTQNTEKTRIPLLTI